jgi:outer membrane murein-binding lipoprotein Lpp
MHLYEIDNEIMELIDDETGEIINEERFDALTLERDAKVENICLWIKNLKAEAEALKAEKDAFAARQKAAENKMNNLKQFISNYLEGTSFKTTKVNVSFRKSESLEVYDIQNIPDEYLKIKAPDVDKVALKDAIKKGGHFEGVELVEKLNIQIK